MELQRKEYSYLDRHFFEQLLESVDNFFIYSVLPEVIGKWYTRKIVADADGVVRVPVAARNEDGIAEEDPHKVWCYCGQPSYGNMIMCEYNECNITWFHFDCLRIRCPPKGKWYCPSCRKQPNTSGKQRAK